MSKSSQALAKEILRRLERGGLNRKYLADRLGVDQSLISRNLSEKKAVNWNPELSTLEAMAEALGAEPWQLLRPFDAAPAWQAAEPTRRAGDHLSPAHQRMIEIVSHMTDAEVLALLHCWESVAEIMGRAERPK